jgi:hypothetical protein
MHGAPHYRVLLFFHRENTTSVEFRQYYVCSKVHLNLSTLYCTEAENYQGTPTEYDPAVLMCAMRCGVPENTPEYQPTPESVYIQYVCRGNHEPKILSLPDI